MVGIVGNRRTQYTKSDSKSISRDFDGKRI